MKPGRESQGLRQELTHRRSELKGLKGSQAWQMETREGEPEVQDGPTSSGLAV